MGWRQQAEQGMARLVGCGVALALLWIQPAGAEALPSEPEPLGIAMEGYDYPYPVAYHTFAVQGHNVRMAYMDVPPQGGGHPSKAVLLLHGGNFFGGYWEDTIDTLRDAGYRVIVPDQIGFGKSSKPVIHYSFHHLAFQTKSLLEALGVDQVAVVGHSMGGMLAVRFALMYPETTTQLVLENPIGLEDYRRKVPYVPTGQIYQELLGTTEEQIRQFHKGYYAEWEPRYEEYVQVHYRRTLSGAYPHLAQVMARIVQMIYEQPIVHELPDIQMETLLVIGQADRTALGKGRVNESVRATLGQYPQLGREAARAIPDAHLIPLKGVGHIPHLAATERFHKVLLEFLPAR